MTKPLIIWLLGDGKPGHENQSLGLADALARRVPCEMHRISLAGKSWWRRLSTNGEATFPSPDLIIAAGHATHIPLIRLARKHRAKSIVLMRPSLPLRWFDLCIVPAHDFAAGCDRGNLILTQGALNRVPPLPGSGRDGKIVLIGGPSGSHGWNGESLLEMLSAISGSGTWQLTDSRRTPDGFLGEIRSHLPGIEVFPHQETTPDWLPGKLATAGEVWVTEDSVSMIYEALSSGATVGLLPIPRKKRESRVIRGIARLISDGFLTPFGDWKCTRALKRPPSVLREADRCAEAVVDRLSL